jgi:protocatechuate 3,4-dioxygenase beta subunit
MEMLGYCFLLIALVAGVQQGQQPSESKPKQAEVQKAEAGTIQGRIVSETTGEPIRKARVLLNRIGESRREPYSTTTSEDGRFTLRDVEPGKYRLLATKNGYAKIQFGVSGPSRQETTLSLDPGQLLRDVVLRMVPQAVISGRVVSEDGEPAERVGVQVLRYRYFNGKRQLLPVGFANTNDTGEYRVFGLSPGRYYLRVAPQTEVDLPNIGGGWQTYAPAYYPSANDPAGAKALELSAGANLNGIDFTLTKTRSVRLRGRLVLTGTLSPIASEEIRLIPRNESFLSSQFWSYSDPQGIFQFRGVIPGSYNVLAQASEGGKMYSTRQAVDVREGGPLDLIVELRPGVELKGRVRVEGRPLDSLSDVHVFLQLDASLRSDGGTSGTVRRDGNFALSNIGAGYYRLNIFGLPEDYYIKSAVLADRDGLDSPLDFTESVLGSLEIILSSNGGQIEGVVLNSAEQPFIGAKVVAVPDEPRRAQTRLYKEVATDQYGRFNIKGIAPGGYKLFAWEEVESGACQDPEFLKVFEALGEPRAIRERSRESAQLKVIPAEGKKALPVSAGH